jgi:hypothetical protein
MPSRACAQMGAGRFYDGVGDWDADRVEGRIPEHCVESKWLRGRRDNEARHAAEVAALAARQNTAEERRAELAELARR